ncbi:unnamed protein product [Schistosoma mattheei]|uniref:Uncharacterized protein n=1 Tax=Schistosoma mattheei TaxID=31246 RepID=A0AA85BD83_9TREM|nr:unnamed protein product [Schistosoma mattheei]
MLYYSLLCTFYFLSTFSLLSSNPSYTSILEGIFTEQKTTTMNNSTDFKLLVLCYFVLYLDVTFQVIQNTTATTTTTTNNNNKELDLQNEMNQFNTITFP